MRKGRTVKEQDRAALMYITQGDGTHSLTSKKVITIIITREEEIIASLVEVTFPSFYNTST